MENIPYADAHPCSLAFVDPGHPPNCHVSQAMWSHAHASAVNAARNTVTSTCGAATPACSAGGGGGGGDTVRFVVGGATAAGGGGRVVTTLGGGNTTGTGGGGNGASGGDGEGGCGGRGGGGDGGRGGGGGGAGTATAVAAKLCPAEIAITWPCILAGILSWDESFWPHAMTVPLTRA